MCKAKEGELYKTLRIEGTDFEIFYGYYSDDERDRWPPTPIFPNFKENPQYTRDGSPFVTSEQDVCLHFSPKQRTSGEEWCDDCRYFRHGEEIIGICLSEERKRVRYIKH